MPAAMDVRLRPFEDRDWPRLTEIGTAIYPDDPRSEQADRHGESMWNEAQHFRLRLVAEDPNGQMVGFGRLSHMPWQFHPDKYRIRIEVDPASQRQGVGTALYERMLAEAQARGAVQLRTNAKETMAESIDFLSHRGFEEIQRDWESRLDVQGFDFGPFATAEDRVTAQGITLTSLQDEGAQDEQVLRKVYALDVECTKDEPAVEPVTPSPYEMWVKDVLESPWSLPEAFFLAKDGDRYVGLSALFKNMSLPHVLQQGFTAVDREYRGKGVAMALKIRGARYALDRGIKEIRTHNNTRNRPMLRINEAMGFVKEPVWIEYGKTLG
jgi:GNAT superfamily N-acetyltransferase